MQALLLFKNAGDGFAAVFTFVALHAFSAANITQPLDQYFAAFGTKSVLRIRKHIAHVSEFHPIAHGNFPRP
jgi:hypothetical protein